jgi:flavodoxin
VVNEAERVRNAKTLVVYYSLTGNTARVARDIAKRMGADLESIRDRDHGTGFFGFLKNCVDALRGATAWIAPLARDPGQYALTLVGTPVWAGKVTPAVRAYLQQTRGRCSRVAFFVTSGNTDVARVLPALEAEAQVHAIAAAGFNARELKEQGLYDAKLASFSNELHSPSATQQPAVTAQRLRVV